VKIQFLLKSDKNKGAFNEKLPTCMIISLSIPPRVRKVLDKRCRENQNTFFQQIFHKILAFMRECGTNTKYIVRFPLQQCYDIYYFAYLVAYTISCITHNISRCYCKSYTVL